MSGMDHAIVVGIRRYPTLGGADPAVAMHLQAPDMDAEAVATWIKGLSDGRPKHVQTIRSADYPDPFGPEGARPIADDIVKAFKIIAKWPRRPDGRVGQRFYFYASGHGFGHERHRGALFTANADDLDRDHVYIPSYFDWLVEAALFEEYVLWFDACSSRDRLVLPKFASLRPIKASRAPQGREMVVYAARFFMTAVENTINGRARGVFTHTLLEGLQGGAVDPATLAVTTASLRNYLINNMRRHMSPQQLADPDVSNEPDFGTVDDFVLVPPAAGIPAAPAAAPAAQAPAGPVFQLSVTCDNPATEIFVVDASNALAARGLKSVEASLPGGDYTVRARLGRSEWQETITLAADHRVSVPSITFASAAPLFGTDRTHETHVAAAREAAQAVEHGPGEGASLMVMARWWTGRGDAGFQPRTEPQAGLFFHHHGEATPLDLSLGAAQGDLDRDRWATRSVTVDPGLHRLALTVEGKPAEMTITALEGWQTRVFLLFEPTSSDSSPQRSKRLSDVSVLMWKEGAEDENEALRMAEAGRMALADERSVMSREMLRIANAKYGNPMMGLYALHLMLLLREKEAADRGTEDPASTMSGPERPARFEDALFKATLANTTALFGEDHPDIRAIRFAAGQEAGRLPVMMPPMLWRSWAALVEASNANPRLLSVDLWESVADQASYRPFMIWLRSTAKIRKGGKFRQVEKILRGPAKPSLHIGPAGTPLPSSGAPTEPGRLAASGDPHSPLAGNVDRRRLSIELGVPRAVIDRALRLQ